MLAPAPRHHHALAPSIAACRAELLARARAVMAASDAEDLVQDTLARALSHSESFEPGSKLGSWLRRIMSNLIIDSWRRKQPLSCDVDDHPAPEPESPSAWRELTDDDLRAAVEALPPSFREVWDLYREGASYAVIGERLGIPRPTVGTRLLRARVQLRKLLLERLGARSAPIALASRTEGTADPRGASRALSGRASPPSRESHPPPAGGPLPPASAHAGP
jgi:RNA polymerase sigma-70 factor (ECF subfamily)